MTRLPVLALPLLLLPLSSAIAGGVVTKCVTDVDPSATAASMDLAGALVGGGNITFQCPPRATIRMTKSHYLDRQTSIDGGGNVTLDARGITAMFEAQGDWTFFISNMMLRNGASSFGNHGDGLDFAGLLFGTAGLVLSDVVIEGTRSPIAVQSVDIRGGRFSNNSGTLIRTRRATIAGTRFLSNPEGIPLSPPSAGGGVETAEIASIENATFSNNLPLTWRGTIEIRRSRFSSNGNDASQGGALWLEGNGKIEKTEFSNNKASEGGAIFHKNGTLEVRRGNFFRNQASSNGGAIAVAAAPILNGGSQLKLSYTNFDDNKAENGGAISLIAGSNGAELFIPVFVKGKLVKFAGNIAEQSGGAIYSSDGKIELARVTFVDNAAAVSGGAIASLGFRGRSNRFGNALIVRNKAPKAGAYLGSDVEIVNSTIANNQGGGIRMTQTFGPLALDRQNKLRLKNSILLNNQGNCPAPEDQATVIDEGHNIQYPGTDCLGSIPSVNPVVDSMYVPALGSPARSSGDNETCIEHDLVQARDVFGEARPEGSICTIGAVESDLERHAIRALLNQRDVAEFSPLRKYLSILGIER